MPQPLTAQAPKTPQARQARNLPLHQEQPSRPAVTSGTPEPRDALTRWPSTRPRVHAGSPA